MQSENPSSEYVQELETLVVEQLLPAYISWCKVLGQVPDLDRVPAQLLRRAQARQNLPALLKPF